jgi:uncharacterized protein YigE (DUF2233 family)
MLRVSLCSVAALAIFAVGLARADDAKKKVESQGKNHVQATIAKVDTHKDTITVKMKDKTGKEVEKTFRLTNDVEYRDSAGRAAKLDAFRPGDDVLITQKSGKVTELRKHARATITHVDPDKGTVTVKMKDKNGKEVERTFNLTEDVEYLDSTGHVATLDVFKSGDEILIIESEGKIKELKKADHKKRGDL